jgi:mRNA interferase RelE/StbE
VNAYAVYVLPRALHEIKHLPGHVRQRVKRAIDLLAENPRPPGSSELSAVIPSMPDVTAHRLKIDKWRILYAVDEGEKVVDVMAVRQRPPYDYGDLTELIQEILRRS